MALVNCVECGHEVSSRAATCPKCGFPVSQLAQLPRCADCGQPLPQGSTACPHCGCPVESSGLQAAPEPERRQRAPRTPRSPKFRFAYRLRLILWLLVAATWFGPYFFRGSLRFATGPVMFLGVQLLFMAGSYHLLLAYFDSPPTRSKSTRTLLLVLGIWFSLTAVLAALRELFPELRR